MTTGKTYLLFSNIKSRYRWKEKELKDLLEFILLLKNIMSKGAFKKPSMPCLSRESQADLWFS